MGEILNRDEPIAPRDTGLALSERDRPVYFEALINPPPLSERLKRAFINTRDALRREKTELPS